MRQVRGSLRKRFSLVAASVFLAAGSLCAQNHAPPAGPTIQQQLDTWFKRASRAAPGEWGIAVANQSGQMIWGVNPTKPMIPASTVKLFTTGFARTVLGGDARRLTRVRGSGSVDPQTGTWLGTWALELNGDPSLERPGRSGPTLFDLARQLSDRGIRRLSGPMSVVSVDGSAENRYPSVWSPRHWGRIFAPLIGPMTLHENVVTIGVGPGNRLKAPALVVHEAPDGAGELVVVRAQTVAGKRSRLHLDPTGDGRWVLGGKIGIRARAHYYTRVVADSRVLLQAAWAKALKRAGINWIPSPGLSALKPTEVTTLAEVTSQSFDTLASEINRRSVNLGAELLLRWAAGGDARAADRLTAHVQQITGDQTGVHLVDGSGLSGEDRAAPWTFVSYLARFPFSPGGRNFPQLLPANGTGTLYRLANGFPDQGVVRAKTGTLGNAATISGYLGRPDGVLILSLMYNGPRVYAAKIQEMQLFRLLGANGVSIHSDSVFDQMGGTEAEPAEPKPTPEP